MYSQGERRKEGGVCMGAPVPISQLCSLVIHYGNFDTHCISDGHQINIVPIDAAKWCMVYSSDDDD